MAITLQKRIGYLLLILSAANLIHSLYQIITRSGSWGYYNSKFYSQPYFEQIFPYLLFDKISISSAEEYHGLMLFKTFLFFLFSFLPVFLSIILILNKWYSKTLTKVFLVVFILLNIFAILVKSSFFLPVRNEFSTNEIAVNKYLMNCIYYYSVMSFIALLMFIGLFFCKTKKEEKIETTSI